MSLNKFYIDLKCKLLINILQFQNEADIYFNNSLSASIFFKTDL